MVAFARLVAHDLRSPLASAMGMLDLIRERFDDLDPDVRSDLLARASNALRSMSDQLTELTESAGRATGSERGDE